jgi:hypothetical protein
MKRVLMGIVWFIVLYLGVLIIGGAIVGALAGAGQPNPQQAAQAGRLAGNDFGQTYGALILIGSLLVAIAGSVTGILPGTKKKK